MATLIIALTVAGYTEYSVYFVDDHSTCHRWGKSMVQSGEASTYSCVDRA